MKKSGCFVDDCVGESCVFDNGEPIENCGVAVALNKSGKGKNECEYWITPPAEPEKSIDPEVLMRLANEVRAITKTGTLPDGDEVNVPTLLWAEEWAN